MQEYFQWPRIDLTLAVVFAGIAAVYFGAAARYFLWDISLGKYPAPTVNPREFWLVRYALRKRVVTRSIFCGTFLLLGLIAMVFYVFNNQGGENAALLFVYHRLYGDVMRRVYKYATC